MRRRIAISVCLLVIVAGTGLARQSSLAKVGVTPQQLQAWVKAWIAASTASDGTGLEQEAPHPSPAALKALQAMSAAEKLALTQEALAAVKAHVTSAAFRAEHTAMIAKQGNRAIDHGIDVNTYGRTGDIQADATWSVLVPMIQMMRSSFPPEGIRQAYEDERTELAETIKTETGDERAKAQKYLTKLNSLAPLMKTNPEEFKKQYTLAKLAAAGGPDTEEKLQAMTGKGQDIEKIRLEQTFWNKYRLDAILRKNLTGLIDQAAKLDFKIKPPTPAEPYVGEMSSLVALELSLGQGPTNAAVQFARAWLKELK